MPVRMRRIHRIAETQSLPTARLGYGYGHPLARQADLIDQLIRPAMRRAATIEARFPSRAVLARSRPQRLNASDGSLLPLVGDRLNGQKLS